MSSGKGWNAGPQSVVDQHPQSDAGALVRLVRDTASVSRPNIGATMDLAHIQGIRLVTLAGAPIMGKELVGQRTLLVMIEHEVVNIERASAQLAWVRERLDPDIALVLVWPAHAAQRARSLPDSNGADMYLDIDGDAQRILSPDGVRIVLLIDPFAESVTEVSADSGVFDIARRRRDGDERREDHMIDLGDVFR